MFDRLTDRLCAYCAPQNPLYKRNAILLSLALALPFLAIFASGFVLLHQGLTELSLERRYATSLSVALALHERLELVRDKSISLSIHPVFREAVIAGDWEAAEDIMEIFMKISNEPFVDDIFLADPAGVGRAITSEDRSTVGESFSHRDWYKGVTKTGEPYLSDVYERAISPSYRVVSYAVPILDDSGKMAAITGFQIRLDHFTGWSRDIPVGEDGFIYVVGSQGKLITPLGAFLEESVISVADETIIARALSGDGGTEVVETPSGRYVVAHAPVPRYGWVVFVQQPAEAAFATRNTLLLMVSVLSLVVFSIYALVIFFAFRYIVHRRNLALSPVE